MLLTISYRTLIQYIITVLFAAIFFLTNPPLSFSYSTQTRIPIKLLYIVDGDTLKIIYQRKKESVRLIGIDTPESRNNRRATTQSKEMKMTQDEIVQMGRTAKRYVESLVKKGDTLLLEFDAQPRDRYGRILAYVYLANRKMLNKEIISNGFAMPLTIPPNVRHAKEFVKLYRKAREEGKGLWKLIP